MSGKKKLTICGDSWFSTDKNYPDCSFGEVLRDQHNLELVNLARSGISNFGIALQINKAIELDSDFIIVGCTTFDRLDLPIIESGKHYDIDQGLSNIRYSHCTHELSSEFSQPDKETVISETFIDLLKTDSRANLDSVTKQSLKQYLAYNYDSSIKQQIDCWIMSDAARRLLTSQIPFLFYTEPLFNHRYVQNIDWLDKKYLVTYKDFSYYVYDDNFSSVFHCCPEDAKDFASHWEQRLVKEGFLS